MTRLGIIVMILAGFWALGLAISVSGEFVHMVGAVAVALLVVEFVSVLRGRNR
jgi:hypothetical protein